MCATFSNGGKEKSVSVSVLLASCCARCCAESLAHVWSCDWRHFRYCVCPGGCLSVRAVILQDNECARFGTDRPAGQGPYSPRNGKGGGRQQKTKRLPFLFVDTFHTDAVNRIRRSWLEVNQNWRGHRLVIPSLDNNRREFGAKGRGVRFLFCSFRRESCSVGRLLLLLLL